MQVTENFYNVLWWSKNARQYYTGSAATTNPTQAPGISATSQKHFEALWKSMPAHVEAVLEVK